MNEQVWRIWILAMILTSFTLLPLGCGNGENNSNDQDAVTESDPDPSQEAEEFDERGEEPGEVEPEPEQPLGLWEGLEPSGPTIRSMLGVSTHMKQSEGEEWSRDWEFEKYVELGSIRIREDYHWHKIEPVNDEFHFEAVETQVAMAKERGVAILAMLAYAVDWAITDGNYSTIDPAEYGEFAGKLAERFCGDVNHYEIWNEQNAVRFWRPEADPDHYTKLLKAAYTEIKRVCPQATVLFGGMSSLDEVYILERWGFLRAAHEAHPDLCEYFDVLAIHPYTTFQKPSPEHDYWVSDDVFLPGQTNMHETAEEKLAVMGCPDKPIWYTEMGWPSYEISEQDQARFLARSILLAARDGVEAYFWYTFWDGEPRTEGWRPHEEYFGLFGWRGADDPKRVKPAYLAMKGLADRIGDTRFAGDLSERLELPMDVYALVFEQEDGARIVALWDGRDNPDITEEGETEGGPDTTYELDLDLPEGVTEAVLYDQEGVELRQYSGVNSVALTLTPAVVYLVLGGE